MRPLLLLFSLALTAVHAAYWFEEIKHNGISPSIYNGTNWVVYRNVKDYGAKGDGNHDDTEAIQRAINAGDSWNTRSSSALGITGGPVLVYFPQGKYRISRTIFSKVNTVLMGDPTHRPVIRASSWAFKDSVMVEAQGPISRGLNSFFHEIKNLVFDSTHLSADHSVVLLQFSVSQACQVSNVRFNMPVGATGHIGMLSSGANSPLIVNDLEFIGGGVGYSVDATQYHFKNIWFKDVITGLKMTRTIQATGQGLRFEGCHTGIDTTNHGNCMFNLIDSTAVNTHIVVKSGISTNACHSLVLENVIVDSSVNATVVVAGKAAFTGSIVPGYTWIRGNIYTASSRDPKWSDGALIETTRPEALVNGAGFYHTVVPPTYEEFELTRLPKAYQYRKKLNQVVNVKNVAEHPVAGDGFTDDTASLQAIINDLADRDVAFFPHGIYLLTDTLFIPPQSRLYGEAWPQLMAHGFKFNDAQDPRAMVKVGEPGQVGVAQMTDFLFTVADVLPGTVLVEVNMAGEKPGDVGFFNCHFRVGGARGSLVQNCVRPEECNAAHLSAHFTPSSSVYWENSWSWSANHDLDVASMETFYGQPSDAGGFLIESQHGTWMLGIGSEHHSLYQLNIHNAKNVFVGLQQGEAASWQLKSKNTFLNPAPWTNSSFPSEPDYSWCGASDVACRVGLHQRVVNSTNINLYSSGFWNFPCHDDSCQTNAVMYENNRKLYSYGVSTINAKYMIMESGVRGNRHVGIVERRANAAEHFQGFQVGVMAAYLRQSNSPIWEFEEPGLL